MNNKFQLTYPEHSRIHVALHVNNLQRSIEFYRILLGREPTKVREGYAKFEPENPSLNLALNENPNLKPAAEGLSHFGIEVDSTEAVRETIKKFEESDLEVQSQEQVTCCYAVQDKVWVKDPDGNSWEVFVVTQRDAAVCCDEVCCGEKKEESLTACC